ncbi:MAG: HAMP domain-containing histidine kinase [Dactylosporangium sp.]|nr:HAMP domain-containing histidine kinase [Dactylosporangium sp.]
MTVVALAAVALVIADTAGVMLLRSNLIERIDRQLNAQSRGFDGPSGRVPDITDPQQQRRRPSFFAPDSRLYHYDVDGELITDPGFDGPTLDLSSLGDIRDHADDRTPMTIDGSNGTSWRVRVTRLPDDLGYGVSAVSLAEVDHTSETLLLINIAVTGVVLLMLGAAAAGVVRIGLRPLTRMQTTAETIAAGDLSPRVADADQHTEAGRLGTALNVMLGRIEAAVAEQTASEQRLRQLLGDAAHELRTPLTSIQGFAELYRRGGAPPGPHLDEAMGRIESEVSRMRLLVNDMLLLARLDEERPLRCQPVDLLSVAADAVRDAHVRVPSRFVELSGTDDRCETFEPVTALADEPRIRQVVTNLVANALQHTPDDARIIVKVGRPPATADPGPPTTAIGGDLVPGRRVAAIEVVDTGPGMTAADAQRVFERLYRADPSRSRRHGGAGLGLAIVASIVASHGGKVELWTGPGTGARFRVLLPARPPAVEDEDETETETEPEDRD